MSPLLVDSSIWMVAGVGSFCLGVWFLGEYRKAFFANPKLMLSLEVWSQAITKSGPGYLAAFLFAIAACFFFNAIQLFAAWMSVHVL